ncbi:MAG: restriction endonuclease subunit S [Bdellovibrionales bacterium]|nr:restriction endonuclease subunit S [Bdellovibrionales bacterium]
MSKGINKNSVPNLRFPEFKKDCDWKEVIMRDVFSIFQGFAFSSSDARPEGCRWLKITDVGIQKMNHETQSYLPINFKQKYEKFIVREGDFVMALTRPILGDELKIAKVDAVYDQALLNQRVGKLVTNNIYSFVFYLLQRKDIIKQIGKNIAGREPPNLSSKHIDDIKILVPKLDEQQKIADCLSSLDDLIAAQNIKVENLKNYKRGLLQQLFPIDGEAVPRLRFPEFKKDGDWKVKKLGEFCNVLMCKRIFAEQTNPSTGVPFYKIGTLGGKPDAYISKELFNEYKSKYNYPRIGEVLITCSGTVGKCLPFDGEDSYYQDSNIVWIDNPTTELSNDFLHILIQNIDWSHLSSTTITRIYGPDLKNLSLTFPDSAEEQDKIAKCIVSIDELILSESNKTVQLEEHKKGLLQQLFPSINTESKGES